MLNRENLILKKMGRLFYLLKSHSILYIFETDYVFHEVNEGLYLTNI